MNEGGLPLLMCPGVCVEVDEAVRREKDPMGGRGRNGCIGEMLEGAGKNAEEVLESAV